MSSWGKLEISRSMASCDTFPMLTDGYMERGKVSSLRGEDRMGFLYQDEGGSLKRNLLGGKVHEKEGKEKEKKEKKKINKQWTSLFCLPF